MRLYSVKNVMSPKQPFSKNFVENKNRNMILTGYPNKKRRFHFLYPSELLKKKPNYHIKLNHLGTVKLFGFLTWVLFSVYSTSCLINSIEIFSINFIVILGKIFNFLTFILSMFILIIFFSTKNVETGFLNKITLSYIYLNLVLTTEKCILLSGAENTWILFKIMSTLVIYTTLWEGKNNVLEFSLSSDKEDKLFWRIKTSFLTVFSLDFISKFYSLICLNFSIDEIFNFPSYLLNLIICLNKERCFFIMTDFWLFSTLGNSFILITWLIFLYSVAFVNIKKNSEIFPVSFKRFLSKKLFTETKKLLPITIISSSTSNLNSSGFENRNIIQNLLLSEKGNLFSTKNEEVNRWKIKKKGIKTPFPETVWNNELPILKQNLWYEIKSR